MSFLQTFMIPNIYRINIVKKVRTELNLAISIIGLSSLSLEKIVFRSF